MKNCSKHAVRRWAERIRGYTGKELDYYASANREKIIKDINNTLEYATLVYKGQIGNNVTRHFYVKDTMVLVTNTTDDTVVTVMVVDFGFSDKINLTVAQQMLQEILELEESLKSEDRVRKERVEFYKDNITLTNLKIERYKQVLKNLETEKKSYEAQLEHVLNNKSEERIRYEESINQLLNSRDYRADIETM